MIDLHSHILPGIDDGAANIEMSLAMARAWVADGVTVVACTPHILPGLYHNTGVQIRQAVAELQFRLDQEGIPLQLVAGADNHIVGDFAGLIQSGHLLTLADTRYVLVELPHHVAPARLDDCFFGIQVAGFVPVFTHPERCTWIKQHYTAIQRLAQSGVWMQITAGSLIGAFGGQPKYWAERMLDEGLVHILASDAHDTSRRPPVLSKGRDAAAKRVGLDEAENLVLRRPLAMLENKLAGQIPMPGQVQSSRVGNAYRDDTGREAVRASASSNVAGSSSGFRSVTDRLRRFFN